MLEADGEGHVYALEQETTLDLGFEGEVAAVAGDDDFGDGAGVTMAASPGDCVFRVGFEQATFFDIFATVIVSVEVAAIYGFVGGHWFVGFILALCFVFRGCVHFSTEGTEGGESTEKSHILTQGRKEK